MSVLITLAERDGNVVTRDEIFNDVWGDVVVTDESLTRCISELRQALGDNRGQPKFVQTIPKVGYRLVEPVRSVASVQAIAVVPFTSLGAADDEAVGQGLAEDILNALAAVEGLRVAAYTSADSQTDSATVGKAANVDAVLQGSVRKREGALHVTARLISASDGFQLWSQSYRRDMGDVFQVQEEIARSIANSIHGNLRDSFSSAASQPPMVEAEPAPPEPQARHAKSIELTLIAVLELGDAADELVTLGQSASGRQILQQAGRSLVVALDDPAQIVPMVDQISGVYRGGVSCGDVLFDRGIPLGETVLRARALLAKAQPGELLLGPEIALIWDSFEAAEAGSKAVRIALATTE